MEAEVLSQETAQIRRPEELQAVFTKKLHIKDRETEKEGRYPCCGATSSSIGIRSMA
jgi:hypothetical protein